MLLKSKINPATATATATQTKFIEKNIEAFVKRWF